MADGGELAQDLTLAELAEDHLRGTAVSDLEHARATSEDHEEAVRRIALLDDRAPRREDLLGRVCEQRLALLIRERGEERHRREEGRAALPAALALDAFDRARPRPAWAVGRQRAREPRADPRP